MTYVQCLEKNDDDKAACEGEAYFARATCPMAWREEWDEQRAAGTFVGKARKPKHGGHDDHHA